jgi:hypothetical protein
MDETCHYTTKVELGAGLRPAHSFQTGQSLTKKKKKKERLVLLRRSAPSVSAAFPPQSRGWRRGSCWDAGRLVHKVSPVRGQTCVQPYVAVLCKSSMSDNWLHRDH